MKMAARELPRYDIRVHAICPGGVRTNIEVSTIKRNTKSVQAMYAVQTELQFEAADPADVADVCLFLASRLSRHVSGTEIYVDGGSSLT